MTDATDKSAAYEQRPCVTELALIVAAGAIHVVTELLYSAAVSRICNAIIGVLVAGYIVWRMRTTPGVLRIWGFRSDNLRQSLLAHLAFAVLAMLGLLATAATTGSIHVPSTFWIAAAVYPLYGIAQQFVLQNFLARNLRFLIGNLLLVALAAAALFGLSHYPRIELVTLAFIAGVFFTLIYQRFPNIWAVGLAHGLTAALVFYLILGEDPGANILKVFR